MSIRNSSNLISDKEVKTHGEEKSTLKPRCPHEES